MQLLLLPPRAACTFYLVQYAYIMGYCIRFNVNHLYPSTVNIINLQQCMNYMVSTYNNTLLTTAAAMFSALAAVVGVVLKNANIGQCRQRGQTQSTIIREPPVDQTPGWPIIRLPLARAPPGFPRQCSTLVSRHGRR